MLQERWMRRRWVVALASVLAVTALFILRPIGPGAFASSAGAVRFVDRGGLPRGTVLARDTEHAVHVPLRAVSPHFLATIVAVKTRTLRSITVSTPERSCARHRKLRGTATW